MGIPSPLLEQRQSPFSKSLSRGATPLVPLKKVDEHSGKDFQGDFQGDLLLGPPALPLKEELSRSASNKSSPALASQVWQGRRPPDSPLWPMTPPSLSQLVEHNTFLDFHDNRGVEAGLRRPRAFSLSTGEQILKSGHQLADFCGPDADSESDAQTSAAEDVYASEDDAPQAQQEWLQECYYYVDNQGNQMQMLGSEQEGQWCEDGTWSELSPSTYVLPSPPPMPEGDVYKPHWIYGSTWPFNCAPTTLTLEDLPFGLTQRELINVLDGEGFSGLYDFVFLPSSLRTGKSSCHAIVNFARHSHGLLLAAHYHGRTTWGVSSGEPRCKVKWSFPRQGLPELLEHYRNDVTMHESVVEDLRPALFCEGWRIPMPLPTKYIRAPKYLYCNRERRGQVASHCAMEEQRQSAEVSQSEKVSEKNVLEFESKTEFPSLGAPVQKRKP